MRYFLLIFAVVMGQSVLAADKKPLISDSIVMDMVCKALKKPYGKFAPPVKLTKVDLAKIAGLDLTATRITDTGLKDVAKLKNLTRLLLSNSKITDAGIGEVAKLKNLTVLSLYGTEVTDECLKEVAKLQRLTVLDLSYSQITNADGAELRKALPKCQIKVFERPRRILAATSTAKAVAAEPEADYPPPQPPHR